MENQQLLRLCLECKLCDLRMSWKETLPSNWATQMLRYFDVKMNVVHGLFATFQEAHLRLVQYIILSTFSEIVI